MIRRLLVPAYLFVCILLGGASTAGYLPNMLLQLMAVPILCLALLAQRQTPLSGPSRSLLILTLGMIALLLLQLVPLPPSLWSLLPGRERIVQGYELLGAPLPWLPITLAPSRALATTLWILPAIAILLGILRLGAYRSAYLAGILVAAALLSIGVGGVQAADADSPFYFYRVTNFGVAVGFFANANHLATLLLMTIPFAAALLLSKSEGRDTPSSRSARVLVFAALFLVIAIGLAINGSLAGIGLAVPVVGASLLIARKNRRKVKPWWGIAAVGALTIGSVAVVVVGPFGNNLTSAEAQSSTISRYTSISTTAKAGLDYLPAGSGLGSFQDVYRTYEDPNGIIETWMNHAHSDFAEIFLELGLPGVLLVILFLIWWTRRTIAIWSSGGDVFARAASIATGAVLAHSLVDYPLRTAAIAAAFAACCALMAEPRERSSRKARSVSDAEEVRHLTA
jgi:O-antigen ligase